MASGEFHCEDCSLYFDSSKSLEVHIKYHKKNLMNQWMQADDNKEANYLNSRDNHKVPNPSTDKIDNCQTSIMEQNHLDDHHFIKNEPDMNNPSTVFTELLSPMEYDYKLNPALQSPQSTLIPQGPTSGPAPTVPFPQPSPGSYYPEYNQPQVYPSSYIFNSSNFNVGGYNEPFYDGRNGTQSRYHPYTTVRTPTPTPPGLCNLDIKEERLTPNTTPEILDLDSQKVLNSAPPSNQMISSLPPINTMWRSQNHQQYMPNGMSGPPQNLMVQQPNDLISPHGGLGHTQSNLGVSSGGISINLGHNPSIIVPSATRIGGTNMGLSQNSLGSSMLPSLGQASYACHNGLSVHPNSIIPSSSVFSNEAVAPFYNQGLGMGTTVTNNSSVTPFSVATSPTNNATRGVDTPPSEYPSNVKRAKNFKCEICNKWFTSHGHLKRHYNTTLHKNMIKQNNSSSTIALVNNQPQIPEITRAPIISPSAKSISETSNHNEESNLSTEEVLPHETQQLNFNSVDSAFQPHNNYSTGFSTGQPTTLAPMNSPIPQYGQLPQSFSQMEQSMATTPAMYHGHFRTANPTSYPPTTVTPPFFVNGNNFSYQVQGGHHGPGFHHVSEFPGPNSVEGFNSYRHINGDRLNHQLLQNVDPNIVNNSPSPPNGETSENSNDSSNHSTQENLPESFKCNDCSKTFNRMCYLTQHRSTYHEGEKPHKCTTCGKRFQDEVIFREHQGKHAGEKPYKCEVCPKQFNHKTDLRRHMCLHTGEKPFKCEQCGKGFIRKDHMIKHHQTHRKKALAAAANAGPSHPNGPGFGPHHHGLGGPPSRPNSMVF